MNQLWKSRLPLIIPFVLFAVFFVIYTIVWNRGAAAMREEIAAFAAREEAAGRTFDYGELDVAGYPFTLRGTLEDLEWGSDALGRFEAEEVIVATLPYDPSRIIFAPRGERRVTVGGETYDLQSEDLRFSLEDGFVAMEAHGVVLTGEKSTVAFDDLIANSQRLDGQSALAISLRQLRVEGENAVTIPFFDLAGSRAPGRLTIAAADLGIGRESDTAPTQLAGKGNLASGAGGALSGSLELRFKNEEPLIRVLEAFGVIDAGTSELVVSALAGSSDQGTKEITLPVRIDEGELSIGFIPLLTLPPVQL